MMRNKLIITIDDIADEKNVLEYKKKKLLKFKSDFRTANNSNNIIKNIYQLLDGDNISYKIVEDQFLITDRRSNQQPKRFTYLQNLSGNSARTT